MSKQRVVNWDKLPILMSVAEAGRALGLSYILMTSLMAQPEFPKVKIGNRYRVYREGLLRWMNRFSSESL